MRHIVLTVLLLFPVIGQAEPFRDCATCPEMIPLPAGAFLMGAPDSDPDRAESETPRHSVTIATPFALGQTEVTRADYSAFVEDTGYPGGDSCWTDNGISWDRRLQQGWASPGFPQGPNHPVICVNTADAQAYVIWLSRKTGQAYRLPTEAEWEYAARAGTHTRFPYGDDLALEQICRYGNGAGAESGFQYRNLACRDEHTYTAPTRAYPPNPWGLYGMLGNALEWTQDCVSTDYSQTPRDGSAMTAGDCRYRVLRSGTWAGAAQHMRVTNRGLNNPAARWSTIGFRVARDIVLTQ